jgi:hypothetical protein
MLNIGMGERNVSYNNFQDLKKVAHIFEVGHHLGFFPIFFVEYVCKAKIHLLVEIGEKLIEVCKMAAKSKMAPKSKTQKNLILLPNGQFSTDFKKLLCVLFVVLASTNIR